MLRHVALEVRQKLHLLLELCWIVVAREIRLFSLLVDEVNVAMEGGFVRKRI